MGDCRRWEREYERFVLIYFIIFQQLDFVDG